MPRRPEGTLCCVTGVYRAWDVLGAAEEPTTVPALVLRHLRCGRAAGERVF